MSFLLTCPQCGPRDVYEFRWGGEQSRRPPPGSAPRVWTDYLYLRRNAAGPQPEWWYHRAGCHRWFLAIRDTRVNRVERTFWPSADTAAPASAIDAADRSAEPATPPAPASPPRPDRAQR